MTFAGLITKDNSFGAMAVSEGNTFTYVIIQVLFISTSLALSFSICRFQFVIWDSRLLAFIERLMVAGVVFPTRDRGMEAYTPKLLLSI